MTARWVENPALHLTALYYMQEQRKRPGCENEPAMKEMQEEIANDFTKGTYIVAVQNEGKAILLVKIGEDQLFWPLSPMCWNSRSLTRITP